jgi:hypothetical protein
MKGVGAGTTVVGEVVTKQSSDHDPVIRRCQMIAFNLDIN